MNINISTRHFPVEAINQVISDSNNGKCVNPLVGNLEQIKNSSTGFSQQSTQSKSSCFFVRFVKFIRGELSKLFTSQGSKSGKATYGCAAPETKKGAEVTSASNAKVAEKANISSGRGIPLPPPPPPPPP
ncbi:hypothetical protein, partial [Pectobacterium brasiliense]|uniref:hypothetical protein n=1 Tax=Pectobacterium brasiliense TaxID=180957 RepID=UPI00196978F8